MSVAAPLVLGELLRASDSVQREAAWEELISRHTRLLLFVARSFHGGHDEAMERYSYVLGKFRESDFHRLRAFNPDAGASFSTWLAVTTRRLCLDHHRSLYGRQRPAVAAVESDSSRSLRRRLVDWMGTETEIDLMPDAASVAADTRAVLAERDAIVARELSKLLARERLLLALRFQDGLSASRIARILGLSTPFHVYRELNSTLRHLRAVLTARGFDNSDV